MNECGVLFHFEVIARLTYIHYPTAMQPIDIPIDDICEYFDTNRNIWFCPLPGELEKVLATQAV